MTQYLVAIHHPDDYDPSTEGEAMGRDIDALNEEMSAAGVTVFVGGLGPQSSARSLRTQPGWSGCSSPTGRTWRAEQGAHRWLLGAGSRHLGRGAGVGPQGGHRLPGAGRGASVSFTSSLGTPVGTLTTH